MAAERIAQHVEDVALNARDAIAFGDGNVAASGYDSLVGCETDEGVAAHLLAALDRLQQKAFALCPRRAQKCGHGRLQVRRHCLANGHQRVLFGERKKLFTSGLNEIGGGFHRLQFNCRMRVRMPHPCGS